MARLLLTGFYGRGNAGDEAILQCMYEALAPLHDVAIAFHPADTHRDFRNWYPYNECMLVDESSIGRLFEHDPDALVIGGGGLPPAFGAHLALTMQASGRPTLLAGTDNLDLAQPLPAPQFLAAYLAGFRYIGLRFELGVRATRALGVEAAHGADWAVGLEVTPQEPPVTGRACAVTVRAWDPDFHDHEFRFRIHGLFRDLRAEGYAPFLLPFSPDDEQLAQQLAPMVDVPVAAMWWNPRSIKGVMARCALVISLGRLHALIFAAPLGVPVCHLMPPISDAHRPNQLKVTEGCREFGVQHLQEMEAFSAALRDGKIGPADRALVQAASARWESMVRGMRNALAPTAPGLQETPKVGATEPLGKPARSLVTSMAAPDGD